ncbi:MAG: TolB family protein [Candidatus Latescibacterota bacterium]
MAKIMLYEIETGEMIDIGQFHSEPQYTKDIRCDLNPRWSRDGKTITFDSVHEGTRQIWTADVSATCAV